MLLLGAGRIGTALYRAARERGRSARCIDRTTGWEALEEGPGEPVLVCTRNDDLVEVVARVPERRKPDLVFVQNGAVRPWLDRQGLGACGRGLLYFAVTERHGAIQPGRTSWFSGAHADALASLLTELGAASVAVEPDVFRGVEYEKLLWLCLMGPLCERLQESVDVVATRAEAEVRALCAELAPLAGVDLDSHALADRLLDYSRSLPGYRASVKEWRWRNGSLVAASRATQIATPLHEELLRATGHLG